MKARAHLKVIPDLNPQRRLRVGVIIPAWNEAKSLPSLFSELAKELAKRTDIDWRIVLVDDGSTDGTREILTELQHTLPLWSVHHPFNLGIGASVQTGLNWAKMMKCDFAIQMDGDGQHPPAALSEFIAQFQSGKYELIIGSRYVEGAGGNVSTLLRQIGTRFISIWIYILYRRKIVDVMSGFRGFGRRLIHDFSQRYPEDYPEAQSYAWIAREKLTFLEIPVQMRRRHLGKSSISFNRSIFLMFKVCFALLVQRFQSQGARTPW